MRRRSSTPPRNAAGIPQYWTVGRDPALTVTLHRLSADGAYERAAQMPLGWLLQTSPGDHLPQY
ncbi:hypothetical protein [Pseudosporangium ferrugineum]|uniref:Uncharacterized protein n=1 Tax=Pseudosporangium ferrugineum TaxID=439699 RepID=A0A2T0S3M3_9ACTN|nr:hypothetical protein [Pseudosporangium ferrugineum]PRY27997.1 hypothetical protein CLV70_109153 [Pseudosporangium ferrugineum]